LHTSFHSAPAPEPAPEPELPDRPTIRGTEYPPATALPEGDALDAEIGDTRGRATAQNAAPQEESHQAQRIAHEVEAMERMYCPCAGFMYNSLGGERNVLASDSPFPHPTLPLAILYSPSRPADGSVQAPPCCLPCVQAGKRGQGGCAAARGRGVARAGLTWGRRAPQGGAYEDARPRQIWET
jgi:hypothetical protein